MKDIEQYNTEITRLSYLYKSYLKYDSLKCYIKETTIINNMLNSYTNSIKEILLNNEFISDVLKEEIKKISDIKLLNKIIKKYQKLININIKSIKFKQKMYNKYNKELELMKKRSMDKNKKIFLNRMLKSLTINCEELYKLKNNK